MLPGGVIMKSNERVNLIDDFFKNLSIEEFEQILIRSGIDEIKPASDFDVEMLLQTGKYFYASESLYTEVNKDKHNYYEANNNLSGAA